ncbi:MAG: hypothetical protein J6P73_01895 [Bacteroidales bacterium]|nr:hypothetical protein [Bacteroidales bacterium]
MKRVLFVWLVLVFGIGGVYSQTSQENLTRNVLASFDANEVVKPGEFQMELSKGVFFNENTDNPWFSYVYTTSNRFTGNCVIMVNERAKMRDVGVRTYRIGSTFEEGIFVIKNTGASTNDMGRRMEMVIAYGAVNPICDSVLYLNDDGYVYSLNGNCFYCKYKNANDNQSKKDPVVWLRRKTFKQGLKIDDPQKAEAFARLSNGDVYFESSEGHYYYLYRDQYMPNTVMVVDNKEVELFDVYDEKDLKLRFSSNGKHWMAVGKECFWVNGVLKSVEGYDIADFLVTDDGHYAYRAYEKANKKKGEVVVYDGHIIRRNADVCYFGLNGEGKLKIRFVSGDRYLEYENEKITDVTDALVSVCYPGEVNNRLVQVLSSDGSHKLRYRHGVPSVEIDGVKVTDSEPCYAIYDQQSNVFVWNAIETHDLKTELVVYRYSLANKLFKKLFR